jgi:hypothetical protein
LELGNPLSRPRDEYIAIFIEIIFFSTVNFFNFLASNPWIQIGTEPEILDPDPKSIKSGSETLL